MGGDAGRAAALVAVCKPRRRPARLGGQQQSEDDEGPIGTSHEQRFGRYSLSTDFQHDRLRIPVLPLVRIVESIARTCIVSTEACATVRLLRVESIFCSQAVAAAPNGTPENWKNNWAIRRMMFSIHQRRTACSRLKHPPTHTETQDPSDGIGESERARLPGQLELDQSCGGNGFSGEASADSSGFLRARLGGNPAWRIL